MKKVVFLVLLVILLSVAFGAETLAKKGRKLRKVRGRFIEKCRAVTRGGKVVYSEKCAAAIRRRRRSSRRFITKVKCWRVSKSGKRIKRVSRKCRRCRRGRRGASKRLRRRLAAWRRKHAGLRKVWFYLNKLEKRLSKQKNGLETVTKRKHTKYLALVKKVDELKKQFETAKAEYEKLKKAVDNKETGFESLVTKLQSFEKEFNTIRETYIKHVRIAESLYAKYQKSLSSKSFLELKAELRVLTVCKTKMRWLSHLIKKYVRVKTVHHKEYIFLHRKRKVLVDGKCVCPVVLRPVCGKDGVTYSSRCVARCAGAKVSHTGVCKCSPTTPVPPKTQKPKTTKPKTTKPKTTKPTTKPRTNKPKTNKPTTKPKTTKPKTTKPKTTKPTTKPRTNKPKTTKPKTRRPRKFIYRESCKKVVRGGKYVEACKKPKKTSKPKTTKPKTTKPKTTKPKTTKPKTQKPRTNKPKTTKPTGDKIVEVKCEKKNVNGAVVEACA